jgi:hypothetical protein
MGRRQAAAVEMLAIGGARAQLFAAAIPAGANNPAGGRRRAGRGGLTALASASCGLSAHLRIFRSRCAKPGLRRGSLSGQRLALRPVDVMMMARALPEVQMVRLMAIAVTLMMMTIVMPRVRLGKSTKGDKRGNSNYCSSHQFPDS